MGASRSSRHRDEVVFLFELRGLDDEPVRHPGFQRVRRGPVDGGVRRGSDIVKAVALGAKACMAGRAYLYALGAAGELGVDWILRVLRTDMQRTMALIGVRTIDELDREVIG